MAEETKPAEIVLAPAVPATPNEDMTALRAELEQQRAELERGREELNFLTQTFSEILTAQRATPVRSEPEPEPTDEEFHQNPTQAATRVARAAANQAAAEVTARVNPILDNIAERTWAMELQQVQTADPKNFARLNREIQKYFTSYPQEKKRAGAAWDVFFRLRGQYHDQIRQLDEAEKKTTTVASPNSASPAAPAPEKPKRPELNQKELNMIRGLGITEAAYLKQRYGWEEPVNA